MQKQQGASYGSRVWAMIQAARREHPDAAEARAADRICDNCGGGMAVDGGKPGDETGRAEPPTAECVRCGRIEYFEGGRWLVDRRGRELDDEVYEAMELAAGVEPLPEDLGHPDNTEAHSSPGA